MVSRYLLSCILLVLIAFLGTAAPAKAEQRTALVIGNSAYGFAPLANPANDAADVAAALRDTGFNVALRLNATRPAMLDAIRNFGQILKRNNGMGLFFFAGHGVQINGENYLVPVGDTFASEADLTGRAVKATDVVDAMAEAGNYLNVVILDACRDNALGHSSTRGLSRIDSNARLFISYSTSPGSVAQDGAGRNSPYTKYLTQAIGVPDLSLEQTFKRTLKGVYQETHGKQTPWISSSFFGDFVFRATQQQQAALEPEKAPAESTASPGPERTAMQVPRLPSVEVPPTLTGIYRADGRNPGGSRYTGMVAITQSGDQFSFKWWIGRQIFNGTGHLAGRMLVINWGDATPVVYTFGMRGALDGEWADGTATERLMPFAHAAETPARLSEGIYKAVGNGGNAGSQYQGMVRITRTADGYHLDWKIGTSAYQGEGTLNGNLLTVNWGSSTPVVYALGEDGSLKGLWNAGEGEETLTPIR
jgi:hypothetical protein